MKRLFPIFLFFLGIFCSSKSYAQDRKTSFGIIGGVQFNLTSFEEPDYQSSSPRSLQINYRSVVSYSYGVSFNFPLSKRICLNSGFQITYFRYKFDYDLEPVEQSDPNVMDYATVTQAYLKMPLIFEYQLIKKENFSFSPTLGASIWINAYYKVKTIYHDGHKDSNSDTYTFLLYNIIPNFYCSLKYQFMFSEKVDLVIEPFIEKGISTINYRLNGKTHTMLGINMGIFI